MTARQREIVGQAIGLIAHRGIQELTIRHLASAVGISEPAIYRHFPGKTDILLGVLDVLEREISLPIVRQDRPGESPAVISEYFTRLLRRLKDAPDLSAVVFADEAFMNEEKLAARVRELMGRQLQSVEALIAAGQERSQIRADVHSADLATMLVGTVRLIVRQWHLSGYEFDLEARGARAVTSFLSIASNPG